MATVVEIDPFEYWIERTDCKLPCLIVQSGNDSTLGECLSANDVTALEAKTVEWHDKRGDQQDLLRAFDAQKSGVESQLTQLDRLTQQQQEIEQKLSAQRTEFGHYVYWQETFPKIRDDIVGRFLPLFESETNRRLTELGMTEKVRFDLTAETKSGRNISRFSIQVFDGNHWRSAQTYSRGEWGRVAVSIGFAFRGLLSYKLGQGVGLFMCDEVADQFDSTGMSMFFQMLRKRGGLSMVVSHRPQEEVGAFCDSIITVVKDANTTTVEVSG